MTQEDYKIHKHDFEVYCFSPKINLASQYIDRNVDDLMKWNQTKQARQELMKKYFEQKYQNEATPLCFTNNTSNKHCRPQNEPVENILLQKGESRKQRLKDKENVYLHKQSVPEITKKAKSLKRDGSVYDRLYFNGKEKDVVTKVNNIPEIMFSPIRNVVTQMHDRRTSEPNSLMPLSSWIRKSQQIYQQQQQQQAQQESRRENNEINNVSFEDNEVKHCFFSIVNEQKQLTLNKSISANVLPNKPKRSISNQKNQKKTGLKHNDVKKINKTQSIVVNQKQKIHKLYEYILDANK